jgi:hypothetical protein
MSCGLQPVQDDHSRLRRSPPSQKRSTRRRLRGQRALRLPDKSRRATTGTMREAPSIHTEALAAGVAASTVTASLAMARFGAAAATHSMASAMTEPTTRLADLSAKP